MALNPMHLSKTAEHGTPGDIAAAARLVLGDIDLDPASCAVANRVIRAKQFYTKETDGLLQNWIGTVWLNPPGDKSGILVKKFWSKLVRAWSSKQVTAAIYLGFNLAQLQQLQKSGVGGPLAWKFPLCVPEKRLCFTDLSTGVVKEQPTQSNFITYLPSSLDGEKLFAKHFSQFGEVSGLHDLL